MPRSICALFLIVGVVGCTKHNGLFCSSDADCTADSARPFCDVDGDYEASNHTSNTCIPKPDDCPIERCGCTAGQALSCSVDQLTSCNADGQSTSTTTCSLGCAADARCFTFEPSNNLGDALTDAIGQPDVTLPAGTHIDTDLGLVEDPSNATISVKSTLITQDGGSMIRVFEAKSFVIEGATIAGSAAVAFVSPGPITIEGLLDAGGKGSTAGPGGQDSPAACAGTPGVQDHTNCSTTNACASGGGGAGNSTVGGFGGIWGFAGAKGSPGGEINSTFDPLVGGCRGGALHDNFANTDVRLGGGGGGSIQLVSLDTVELVDNGFVSVNGGGGLANAGGGSGGNLLIEAGVVRLSGTATGIVGNGGAGGGCGASGPDGPVNATAAAAPQCGVDSAGNGGTVNDPPGSGANFTCAAGNQLCINLGDSEHGGGGGSVGRARITTKTGDFEVSGAPATSIVIAKGQLVLK